MATRWHGRSARKCQGEVGSAERRRGHRTAGEAENPHLTLTTPIQPHPSPGTGMGRKIQSLGKTLHPAAPSPWKSTDAAAPGAAMDWNFLLGKGFSWVCRGQAGPIHPCGIIGMLASLSQGSSTPLHSPLLDGVTRVDIVGVQVTEKGRTKGKAGLEPWNSHPRGDSSKIPPNLSGDQR
ncbi:uncharacterized protein LOC104697394 isoform X6 [Corvus cornix cornix]|uniref:uncharacterized protein LOC104697394 isoform X6 n=1 Tax=Corvus cornix cornix TaxID=932674 RepID=UPI00194EA9B5|nr:uncharacterized protein LOC104697394 isoform X6 [Corvus cornix cornix]